MATKITIKCFVSALCFIGLVGTGSALELELPRGAQEQVRRSDPLVRYALPVGIFADGIVPSRVVEGTVTRSVWQIPQAPLTTAQMFEGLIEQVTAQGYTPIVTCAAKDCGGFDFRFGIEVADAPAMFVDLSDFQFASLSKGPDRAVSLLVSTAADAGYIQLVQIGPDIEIITANTQSGFASPSRIGAGSQIGVTLERSGVAVLEDLEFATGASDLTEASFASLSALAAWLNATPATRVVLVGHTDTEGTLERNIALSRRRAEAVVSRIVERYGVDIDQVSAQGVGFLAPRATNATSEGRTNNRRVEVVLIEQ